MKQKIIAIVSGLAVIGFLGKNQIASLTSKYVTHSDTTEAVATESSAPSEVGTVDTILEKSMRSIQSVGEKNLKSDSLIVTRVEKTVTQIQNLNHEVKVLKKENKALRAKLNDTDNVDGHFGLLPISAEIGE
jgi:hypothetical protein